MTGVYSFHCEEIGLRNNHTIFMTFSGGVIQCSHLSQNEHFIILSVSSPHIFLNDPERSLLTNIWTETLRKIMAFFVFCFVLVFLHVVRRVYSFLTWNFKSSHHTSSSIRHLLRFCCPTVDFW